MSGTIWTDKDVERMLGQVGLTRKQTEAALRKVGAEGLQPDKRPAWTPERPFTNYCYRFTECACRAGKAPVGYVTIRKEDPRGSHYYFRHAETGAILDLTAAQFNEPYDYDGGKKAAFMPQLSKGAKRLAEALGWTILPRRRG